MDNISKKSSGIEIPKRNRSLDFKSPYKSRVSEVGENNKKVSEEKNQENVKKKRVRSSKEVSLSGFESDAKKIKREDVSGVKSEQGVSEKSSGGSKGLHEVSPPLGESASAFNFPKRHRDLIGRKKLVADQVSKPLELLSSIDRAAIIFNERFNKSTIKDGTRGQLVRSVTVSAANDGAPKSNYAGNFGGSNSIVKEKVNPKSKGVLHSQTNKKSERKRIGCSDQASKSSGLLKSVDRVGAFNGDVVKPKDNAGTKDRLDSLVTISAGNNGAVNSKSAENVGSSVSKGKHKAEHNLTHDSDGISESLPHANSVDRAGAFISKVIKSKGKAGTGDQSVKLIPVSTGNDGVTNPKFVGKVSSSNSKVNQKSDLNPKGCSNSKGKQAEPKSISGSDRISEAFGHAKSADREGAFNGEVIKHKDQSVKLAALSADNDDTPNSKSFGKVGGLKSKVNQKAQPKPKGGSNSKRKMKAEPKSTSGSDRISEALEHPKSVDQAGASNDKYIKPKDKADTSDQSFKLVTVSAGNDGASFSNIAGKNGGLKSKLNRKTAKPKGGSNSKGKQKAESKLTSGSDRIFEELGHPKSVDSAGAFKSEFIKPKDKADTSDQLAKLVALSTGNSGASISKSVGKVSCSNSKANDNVDPESTSRCNSGNGKLKQKAGPDELNETVNNGHTSSKKRRIKSREDLVIGADGGEASKKKSNPSVGSTVSNSILVDFDEDDDDEENLEQNAARMLSSRFDPSCTGFSSKRKSSASQTVNGSSFPDSSHRDSLIQQANSSSGVGSLSADDMNKVVRTRKEDKGKATPRKRRHFYDVLPRDMDPHWFLTRRIKVFWPLDECWYYGLVDDYHTEIKLHHIKYDDRDEEWIDLQEEKFKLLLLPSEVPGKVKSKKVPPKDNDVRKGETIAPEDDAGGRRSYLDSEPIALWLARSSQHGKSFPKSLKRQRDSRIERPAVSALPSEKTNDLDSNLAHSKRTKSNPHCESESPIDLALHEMDEKSLLESTIGDRAVYVRKKNYKKGESASPDSHIERPTVSALPSEKINDLDSNLADSKRTKSNPHCESASPDDLALLEMDDKSLLESTTGDRAVYARKKNHKKGEVSGSVPRDKETHGSASVAVSLAPVTVSSPTIEEHNFGGFLDYDKQLWSIDHSGLLRLNVMPVESKEFSFQICLPVLRFSWFSLGNGDFWLFRNMLMSQHGVVSITSPAVILEMLFIDSYLGLKFLMFEGCMKQALAFVVLVMNMFSQPDERVNGDMQSPVTSIRLRLSNVHDLRKHHIVGLHSFSRLQSSKWACLDFELLQHCVLIKQLQISECTYNNIKELEYGSLKQRQPHADLELPSYMDSNKFVPHILPTGVSEEACYTRISQSFSFAGKPGKTPKFVLSCSAAPTFLFIRHLHLLIGSCDMGNVNHRDIVSSLESSDAECTQSETSLVSVQGIIGERRTGTLEIEVPAFNGVANSNHDLASDVSLRRNVVENKNEPFVRSSNNRYLWQGGRSSSMSSPHGDLSPIWPDGNHSNRPKRRRTQVQYTLPFAGYDLNSKQKTQNQRDLPCKRVRRASLKQISDGCTSNEKNFELLSCGANVLVTHEDKGWRECGAVIVLEVADHNEWRLAIKLSGVKKYSYKVKHILQPGSTNRYSHAMLWKGGKDWVLEFPDRSQWNLFKEMHEECYNRNIRAASVKSIPIPGVWPIEESDDYYKTKVPFIRNPMKYFRQVQTDVEMAMDPSRILYDIDSDDERWLKANKKKFSKKLIDKNRRGETVEELFEKTMDMFEKVSFAQNRDKFTDNEVQELVSGMGSVEAAKFIYEHWREKRGRKGMPLIRHLQRPLWERYQHQLKEWERIVTRGNSTTSIDIQKKAPTPEKPPMFAFCLKPRGLEIPNRGLRHRSHKKFSVSAHLHSTSRDHNTLIGRRSSGHHTFGDEKGLYTNTVRESSNVSTSIPAMRALSPRDVHVSSNTRSSKAYRNKQKFVVGSSSSSFNNQSTEGNLGGAERPGNDQMDGPDLQNLHEFQVRESSNAADRAIKRAKLKREWAHQLSKKADYAFHKAMTALLNAEAMRDSLENSNEGN